MNQALVLATETSSQRMDERQQPEDDPRTDPGDGRTPSAPKEVDSPYVIPSPEPPVAPLFMNGSRAVMDGYIHAQEKELARTQRVRRSEDLAAVERARPAGRWWQFIARLHF